MSFADNSRLRGRVFGAEYLGTTQIVTVITASGQIKARLPSGKPVQRRRDASGSSSGTDKLSLFDADERRRPCPRRCMQERAHG